MVCECHGVEMYLQTSRNSRYWTCRVRRQQTHLNYWHRADGGYIRRRKRHLGQQRARVMAELQTIEEALLESE